MIRAGFVAFASFSLLLLASARTSAQPRERAPLEFSWTAPKECPAADTVEQRVRALDRRAAALSVRGLIKHSGDRYVLDLDVVSRGERGTRTLEDVDCAELVHAAMVVLELSLAPKEDTPTPAVAPVVAATTTAKAATTPKQQPSPADVSRLTITAGLLGDLGTMPRAAAGLLGSGELRLHRHFGAQLSAMYLPPVSASSGAVSVSVQTFAAAVRGCFLTEPSRLVFAACAGLTLGGVFGSGSGARNSNTDAGSLLLAPSIDTHLRLQLAGAWGLTLGATVALPLERTRFQVLGVGALHEVEFVLGSAYLGPSVAF